jgi:3-dehydroshikimate dehydratase
MALLLPGLVSITFRALTATQIIERMVQAQLSEIEWGGDIHVPAGDVARAREVRRWTEEAGLRCAAYGSYYRLGVVGEGSPDFQRVLDSAVALGVPTIRVWAGNKGSAETTEEERKLVVEDARRVSRLALASGITVSLEYHAHTLTDTRESVRSLEEALPEAGLEFLWQPTNGATQEDCADRLRGVLDRLRHVHVFHWWPQTERLPLAEGETCWKEYLGILRKKSTPTPCLLEFVKDDSVDQFLADAATLRRWISEES